ncbi:MAG TPA: prepilin-type N-terminal cleavage/methylation domain-containing protein [Candidatus Binataceae bacterium]|nr:prepilin-type N-terminal cleavage/methylation domain-containing protein [Candidatus Binataceae bacterium]
MSASSGFTLLELMLVLFLMALVMRIAMPYFGGYRGAELRSQTRRLAGRATYLYDMATAQRLVLQLVFDIDANAYRVMVADPYAPEPKFVPSHSPGTLPVALPADIRIRDVTVEGMGTSSAGRIACLFYPQGYVDATLIHLVDSVGEIMTLGINPLTGRVMIGSGDLKLEQLINQ